MYYGDLSWVGLGLIGISLVGLLLLGRGARSGASFSRVNKFIKNRCSTARGVINDITARKRLAQWRKIPADGNPLSADDEGFLSKIEAWQRAAIRKPGAKSV
ncbi:hypothetical protein J7K50_04015 [bacterium]|nr:hypothetical protein [bacterium]